MALSYAVVKSALDAAMAATGGKFVPFDASFYLANYSVVRDANGAVIDNSLSQYAGDPLQHYVEVGAARGYMPNAWFDPVFYRAQYSDVNVLSAADLIVHYALYGVNEGRAPTAELVNFNGARYLADNPDVLPYVEANLSQFGGSLSNGALAHYLKFGAGEMRKAYDLAGNVIPFTMIPDQTVITGTEDGQTVTVSLNTNDGETLLVGTGATIAADNAGETSVLRLVGDADIRIDMTNPNNQVRGIDLDGDGVIEQNGVENNVSAAGVVTVQGFDVVDAYARNPLNPGDLSQNFLGDIHFDGTGFDGDGVSTDGNIFLGGLGADVALGGIGNDFLAGGGVHGAGTDMLSGGRNADFFFTELSLLDDTDGSSLVVDGGTTADNTSAGEGQSTQDSDWLLVEASDDDEPVVIILEDTNLGDEADGDFIVGNGLISTDLGARIGDLIDIENVDASGNLYGFLNDLDVSLGGDGSVTDNDDGDDQNVGQGSSAQIRVHGSSAANIVVGGYDNDYIEGNGGNDLLMGGNLNYLNNANLAGIVNNGRDELYGGDGNDNIVFEADGGVIDGGANTDTLWLTREALGTRTAADLTNDSVLRFDLENDDEDGDGIAQFAGYGGADVEGTSDQTNYKSSSTRVNVDNMESVIVTGLGAIDYLAAGANNPELNFNNQQNHFGYEGDVDLRGTSGANTLYANTGDDVIEGREGNDNLSGGDGSDDFYFQLTGESGGDGVDVIHRQNDANGDNVWDGNFGRDFDIGGVQTLFDSTFTLGLPEVLAPYVDGVRFQLGGTTYEITGLASATTAEWATKLEAKLDATAGLEDVEVDLVNGGVVTLTDPAGRSFVELTASGWLLTGGGLPSDGLDQWFQEVGAPASTETLDRLIYKSYEDRSDNEGVNDDSATGSPVTLGEDSYAEDLVVDFAADGTRIAEDQSYTITFDNLTTEDTVTITVNGVTYTLQVGVSIDGTQIDDEEGGEVDQNEIQENFLARLADFINSFMDDDTAAGSVSAAATATTLTLTQNAYDGEETVFMKSPTVNISNESGGERATATVANNSQHQVHLLNYVASSLSGQLDRSESDDGSEAALNDENVLFVGEEFVNRATLQTAVDTGETIVGHDAVVINSGVDDLVDVDHNLAVDEDLNSNTNTDGNFAVHGDDYLIGGAGDDDISGGTGDDRVRGSMGDDVVDGGADLYAVRLVGETQYRVEVLNAFEAEQRDADADVLDMYLIKQVEGGDDIVDGDEFSPYFQDTLIFHQADFAAGEAEFTIDLNNYSIDAATDEVVLENGGAGEVHVDVDGDGDFEAHTEFSNFENIRTVSGVGRAVVGNGQGNDTLIVTGLSDDTDGVHYDLTDGPNAGLVQVDLEAETPANDPEVRDWQDVIHVDGVENVIAGLGDDELDIDETEAAKNNLFDADLGEDTINYMNDFDDADVEPTVSVIVESSANTDQVVMTAGRVGTTVATDTLISVENINLDLDTADGVREDDELDVTNVTRDVLVDFTEEEVRADNNNDGDWNDANELLATIFNMNALENVLTGTGADLLIVGDADYMSGNARSDVDGDETELVFDTYLSFDALDDDLNRESVSDMRANDEANNDIPEVLNFEQFTFNLDGGTDRVDYSQTNDRVAALVMVDQARNFVFVDGDLDESYDDEGDRVDALVGVEEIVASTEESILDFTALGQDVQISFQFDETNAIASLDRMENLIRIGDGDGNTIDGIPNFVEYFDLDDDDDVDPFATAAWTRIEGSDFAESVFYDGSEDLANLAGVDHRYTDDVLNLRGGENNVSYFALETSIVAAIDVAEFDADNPLTTGLITAEIGFQDGSGGALAGAGTHLITSYTGDNGIAEGTLKLEASQDAEDAVGFTSTSEKVFLLGRSAGVMDVQIGDLDAMRLTGFELLLDADSDDIYDIEDIDTVLGGLALMDNLADDFDTIVVQDDAVGYGAAPADTIDLGVLNAEFAFDFDALDITNVTENNLILIGEINSSADPETVIVGDLDLIDDISLFDTIVFTDDSLAADDTFVIDTDAGEFRDGSNNVLFTFDGDLDTFDFSRVADAVTVTVEGVAAVTVVGGAGDDTLAGGSGADALEGGAGDDDLAGGFVAEVTETVVVTLPGGAATLEAGDVLTIAGVTIGDVGAGTDIEVVAGSDADQVGSAFVAYATANLATVEANLLLNAGDLAGVSYDATSNNIIFDFTSQAGDVAAGTVTVDDTLMVTGTLTGTVGEDGTDAAGQSVAFAAEADSIDTFVFGLDAVGGVDTISDFDSALNTLNPSLVEDLIDFSALGLTGGYTGPEADALTNGEAMGADSWTAFVDAVAETTTVYADVNGDGFYNVADDVTVVLVGVDNFPQASVVLV